MGQKGEGREEEVGGGRGGEEEASGGVGARISLCRFGAVFFFPFCSIKRIFHSTQQSDRAADGSTGTAMIGYVDALRGAADCWPYVDDARKQMVGPCRCCWMSSNWPDSDWVLLKATWSGMNEHELTVQRMGAAKGVYGWAAMAAAERAVFGSAANGCCWSEPVTGRVANNCC